MTKFSITVFPFLSLFFLSLSCGTPAVDNTNTGATSEFTIVPDKQVGLITPETATHAKVLELYGENARVDSVYLGDGAYQEGVVLYPNDPKKRVELLWSSTPETGDVLLFKILNLQDPTEGSAWKTDSGITLNTSMEDVEKINGAPFTLFGFNWNYGGFVFDWGSGTLPQSLRFRFGPTETIDNMQEISGEMHLVSNAKKVKASKPKVSAILVNLPIKSS